MYKIIQQNSVYYVIFNEWQTVQEKYTAGQCFLYKDYFAWIIKGTLASKSQTLKQETILDNLFNVSIAQILACCRNCKHPRFIRSIIIVYSGVRRSWGVPYWVMQEPFYYVPFLHSNLISCCLIGSLANMRSALYCAQTARGAFAWSSVWSSHRLIHFFTG